MTAAASRQLLTLSFAPLSALKDIVSPGTEPDPMSLSYPRLALAPSGMLRRKVVTNMAWFTSLESRAREAGLGLSLLSSTIVHIHRTITPWCVQEEGRGGPARCTTRMRRGSSHSYSSNLPPARYFRVRTTGNHYPLPTIGRYPRWPTRRPKATWTCQDPLSLHQST